jgi:hypothetical protein
MHHLQEWASGLSGVSFLLLQREGVKSTFVVTGPWRATKTRTPPPTIAMVNGGLNAQSRDPSREHLCLPEGRTDIACKNKRSVGEDGPLVKGRCALTRRVADWARLRAATKTEARVYASTTRANDGGHSLDRPLLRKQKRRLYKAPLS